MYLAKMTTAQAKEAFEKDPIIVIPVGSTERSGPCPGQPAGVFAGPGRVH